MLDEIIWYKASYGTSYPEGMFLKKTIDDGVYNVLSVNQRRIQLYHGHSHSVSLFLTLRDKVAFVDLLKEIYPADAELVSRMFVNLRGRTYPGNERLELSMSC